MPDPATMVAVFFCPGIDGVAKRFNNRWCGLIRSPCSSRCFRPSHSVFNLFKSMPASGGALVDTAENMVRWLSNPQAIDPMSGTPDLGLTEQDACDIASCLYTLK